MFDYWATHYFVLGSLIAMIVGAALLVPLIAIMKQRLDELAAIIFGGGPKRLLAPGHIVPDRRPFVSIHIPAYREPPEMLRQTLDSVAKLDWPNFECIVVINNTPEASYWRPIEEHCELLGPRFKFVREDQLEGFKAGALRLALEHTAPEAEIIGVLDADYVVHPDWLKDLVPAFADADRRSGAGATGPSRRRPKRPARGDEPRICRLLRYRHGAAERGQRHRLARHHVPCAPERADRRRRMVERYHRRGCRSRADAARARLADPLHAPPLWLGPAAVRLRRL